MWFARLIGALVLGAAIWDIWHGLKTDRMGILSKVSAGIGVANRRENPSGFWARCFWNVCVGAGGTFLLLAPLNP